MHPDELLYHKEHTWVARKGARARVGITDFAQHYLGEISFIELPEVDDTCDADAAITEIESEKSSSLLVAPLSGVITGVNEELADTPELINEDPYGNGWIFEMELSDDWELDDLMDASEYERFSDEEGD